jgi:Leucine-rich repeat (LRR) protein
LLEELDLSGNALEVLPVAFDELESLRLLRLDRNKLASIAGVCRCTNLQELYVKSNEISQLPTNLTSLVRLHRLYACRNKVEWLPFDLSPMSSLRTLDLTSNALSAMPSTRVTSPLASSMSLLCASLERLNLNSNHLKWLFETAEMRVDDSSSLGASITSTSSSSSALLSPPALSSSAVATSPRASRIHTWSLSHLSNLCVLDASDNRIRSLTPGEVGYAC